LAELLTVAVCAVLAGASSFAAITDWLYDLDEHAQVRLGFGRGVPAGTTVWRLLTRLDADLLTAVLAGWLRTRVPPVPARSPRYRTVIAIDGKTMRGAHLPGGRQVHLLSALDTRTGVVLAQVTVDTKSDEIPAFDPLLDAVETVLGSLAGVLFVADAMHTQTGHAEQITTRGGHLLLPAKGNQPTLFAQLRALPGRRSRSVTRPATAGTADPRPAPSRPSPYRRPAGSRSRTPSRPSGSPGPAPSRGRPAGRLPT
jgi:hypothetical protein